MSRYLLLVLIAVFCLEGIGCTSTEQVASDWSDKEAVRKIESESRDQSAVLTLASGRTLPVEHVTLGPDSTRWVHPATQGSRVIPTTCVSKIRFARHGRGLLDGFGVGLGVSIVAGLLTATVPAAFGRCEGLAALACGLAGIVVTMGGTVAGTVIGAVRGHRDVYQFATAPISSDECRVHSSVEAGASSQDE